ncbi:protein of unknown function [Clostridium beijerinckii]|nr:protein of unknown function [Clostridium beijerinckii]
MCIISIENCKMCIDFILNQLSISFISILEYWHGNCLYNSM